MATGVSRYDAGLTERKNEELVMSDMSKTVTVKLTDTAKTAGGLIARFKKSSISGATLIALSGFVFQFGGDVLNFLVTNSSVYRVQIEVLEDDIDWLRQANSSLRNEIAHLDHYVVSQNIIARKLLDAEIINMDTYDMIYHAVEHRRDSL